MSKEEAKTCAIIAQVVLGKCTQHTASLELNRSMRHIRRLCRKYKEQGVTGLIHSNRGKPSNRRISENNQQRVLEIIKQDQYFGFGPQLIKEQLEKHYRLEYSREWLRKIMIKEGLWEERCRKNLKSYPRRDRRDREGELLQIDGSYHDWFESRAPKCSLINMVDDATGKIKELRFINYESTEDYFASMKRYINSYGLPLAVYSDRHRIFKGEKGDSQFSRALKELGIKPIFANSPQAKGRVERSHSTLQDRLVKLMRLEHISSIDDGNRFLVPFLEDYNKRFGRLPRDNTDANRKLPLSIDLDRILCVKEKRVISKHLSVQYENKIYQIIAEGNARRLVGKEVTVYTVNGKIILEHDCRVYRYTVFEDQPYFEIAVSRKEVDAFLDKKKPLSIIERHRRKIAVDF